MPVGSLVWPGHQHPFPLEPGRDLFIRRDLAIVARLVLFGNYSSGPAHRAAVLIDQKRLKLSIQLGYLRTAVPRFPLGLKLKTHHFVRHSTTLEHVFYI